MKEDQHDSTLENDDPSLTESPDQKILKSGSFDIQAAGYHLLNEEAETTEWEDFLTDLDIKRADLPAAASLFKLSHQEMSERNLDCERVQNVRR